MEFLENFKYEKKKFTYDNLQRGVLKGVLDFETCATDETNKEARVWASGVIFLDDIDKIYHQRNINDVMQFLYDVPISTTELYIHNLGFDIKFILPFLLKYQFTQVPYEFKKDVVGLVTKSKKHLLTDYTRTFELIEAEGQYYQLTINWETYKKKVQVKNRKTGKVKTEYKSFTKKTILKDSYKKVSSSLKNIAKDFLNLPLEEQKEIIDYKSIRKPNYNLSDDEKSYLFKDCNILAKLILVLENDLNFTKLTASSQALHEFIDITFEGKNKSEKKERFRELFPQLDPSRDNFMRRSYRGGWTYADPRFRCIYDKKLYGKTYDVTSLYPSVMYYRNLPYGEPIYFQGKYKKDDEYNLYIQRLRIKCFKLKKNHLPTLQIKGNRNFNATEYLESNIVDGSFLEVEVTLTNIDLELFFKHYKVEGITYLDGYKFKSCDTVFRKYIDKWIKVKNTSKGAMRSFAKILLNGLYGKFATRCQKFYSDIYIDDKGLVKIDNSLNNENVHEYYDDSVYTPLACFVTAHARYFTISSAQLNYKNFMYADTDSIHLHVKENEHAKGINIDFGGKYKNEKALFTWKWESSFSDSLFLGAKRYMEYVHLVNEKPVEPFWEIKCAGLNEDARSVIKEKNDFCYWDMNTDYDPNNLILDSEGFPLDSKGKRIKGLYKTKKQHKVINGCLILDTAYKLTEREFVGIY